MRFKVNARPTTAHSSERDRTPMKRSSFIPGFCAGLALALALHYFIPCDQAHRGGPLFAESPAVGKNDRL